MKKLILILTICLGFLLINFVIYNNALDVLGEDVKKDEETETLEIPSGENILLVASFECAPNDLGGDIGVYGDGEPDWKHPGLPHSWFYEPTLPYYKKENVHTGAQSFLLVNAQKGVKKRWASFATDMGPTIDKTVEPKKVESKDVSKYKKLVLWVKGEKGGEKFNVIVRDAHARSYMPQAIVYNPSGGCTKERKKIEIKLTDFIGRVDWKNLDTVGLEFGVNIGNPKGAAFYIDDIYFEK